MTDPFSIEGTGLAVPGDALGGIVARVATWASEDLRAEVTRVAAEQDDGQGYGETAWNADTATVFYVCGDWQDPIPITKAFFAIDGVERFASEAEAVPDGWWNTGVEVVYPDPPPRWVTERPAEEATAGVSLTAASDLTASMTMVCVKPRVEEAELIADPDGDPPDILHATLAFLGEVDGDLGHIIEALGPVAASHGPLAGVVGGYGVFSPPGCGILLPDVPGLAELRQAVAEALHGAGIDFGRNHGWTPHITVDQDPEPEELEEMLDRAAGAPLHFDDLLIVRGNTEVILLPLTGVTPPTAALTAAGEDFCLPSELRLRTDPVRQEFVRTVMRPVLENAGLSFSASSPLAAQVLAQAGSHIVGISQTTQADVMKVITDAHEQGLSIPDTASAIREHMDGAANTRATMIARTELAAAANGGALAATKTVAEATGDKTLTKVWLTSPGALHPRHEEYEGLDGQTVSLEDYFDVGGSQMQYPGDPDGDPGDSINCRCSISFGGDPSDVEGMENIDAAAPPRHPVHLHNKVLRKAYKRVDELEPRLVAVLEPILRHAGEVAAANFEALATDHLTAAGDWTPPAGEEILPVSCLPPGLAEIPSLADTISVAGQPPVPFATRQQIDQLGLNDWPPHMGTTAQDIFANAGTKETTALYKDAGGDYLDSRQALHDQIFDAHFAGKVKPEGVPQAFFTAGGGAAGKGGSTFIVDGQPRTLRELTTDPELAKNFVHVDPDAIKLDLPEFQTMRAAGDPYAAYGVHEESSEIAKAVIDRARAEGYNVIIDQTAKGDTFVSKLESMRAQGYEVQVSMTSIPTNDAIARSVARGLNTEGEDAGRFLAIPLLKQAHAGASRQLAKWAHLDWLNWQVFDNSDGRTLVAEAHNGAVTIYDQAKYDEILAKANEVQSSP